MSERLLEGDFKPLQKRGITEETCAKWGYKVGQDSKGTTVHIANYKDETGNIVAQKVRYPNKEFTFLGNPKAAGLYGQWLWRDGGKMVVVTEGEIDALSVSQLQQNKWPVVSIPNGSGGAKKSIQKSLDWLEKFDTVVLMFDMDEPGRQAAQECALLLSPGKAKIASLPLKDANDMLVAHRGAEVISAIWDAKTYRPDGILPGTELWEIVSKTDSQQSIPYPWDGLNQVTQGLRQGELITITAGSGIGKSQVCREIAYHLLMQGHKLGYIALEESVKRSALGLMGLHLNKRIHINQEGTTIEELRKAFDDVVGAGNIYFYDHFGSIESENLLSRIRYLARGCDCTWILLDHISIVVSGQTEGDERRNIDNTMTALRSLVEELGIGLILVSHLRRPTGKGHEEGAVTSLSDLRGSAAIGQLSDMVIGLERNQQDQDNSNLTCVRVLKNRFTGETGVSCYLAYDTETGRLAESTPEFKDESKHEKGNSFNNDF